MIWHPLLLSVLLMDLLCVLLLSWSALQAVRIVQGWSPAEASGIQLRLERQAESVSLLARGGWGLFAAGSLTLILAVADVLPGIVPGAMCGTGVLQAGAGTGGRALALRLVGFLALSVWHLLDRLDRSRPESPLTLASSRALLAAWPVVLVAAWSTLRAVLALDVQSPVECCAVVYDAFRSVEEARTSLGVPDSLWVSGCVGGAVAAVATALTLRHASAGAARGRARLLALLVVAWVPVASLALVRSLAAYHYGVLQHHCPWCLFLAQHGFVGYPLFGALVLAPLEAPTPLLLARVVGKVPAVQAAADRRARQASRRTALAILLFLALSGLPAVVWRVRFGVWMG